MCNIVFTPAEDDGKYPLALTQCVKLQTTEDNFLEVPESVSVKVNSSSLMTNDNVMPSIVSIMVLDNDCEYIIIL